jgi:ribosome biogenesis protein Tsr3
MSANDPKRTPSRRLDREGHATSPRDAEIQRAMLVIRSVNAHISNTDTPDLGADGRDYRADFVHGRFPENQ